MADVHVGNVIKDLIAFYQPILDVKLEFDTVFEQTQAFGLHAYTQFKAGDHRSIFEFNNYNPKYIGKSNEENIESNPTKEDFLETAANCFSFKDFNEARTKGNIPIDVDFESAVDLLLAGELDLLINKVKSDPTLLTRNSQYPHKAGLIHYAGSNGVEAWRQVVPYNLVEILKALISEGAEPDMWNNIYNMSSTLKGLIETSAHPYQAGLTKSLVEVL